MSATLGQVRTEPIKLLLTPRLEQEARAWTRHSERPSNVDVPGPGQVSVWDYPRPPALERVLERVTIRLGDVVIADTGGNNGNAIRVCETASPPTYYLPRADVQARFLRPYAGSSHCEWKGSASYHSLVVGEQTVEKCAWSYANPCREYDVLRDTIAFYPRRFACTVGALSVRPQPGQFYAGWITPDLVGPFKGEPGSHGW